MLTLAGHRRCVVPYESPESWQRYHRRMADRGLPRIWDHARASLRPSHCPISQAREPLLPQEWQTHERREPHQSFAAAIPSVKFDVRM